MYVGQDFALRVRVVRCRWGFINLKPDSARAFRQKKSSSVVDNQ
jgi:hypothetical protein